MGEVASRLREDLDMLRAAAQRQSAELRTTLRAHIERNPLATLACGFGAGYVLGGGLFSRFTGPLMGVLVRLTAAELLGKALGDLDSAEALPA
jgi:hypothetical protein